MCFHLVVGGYSSKVRMVYVEIWTIGLGYSSLTLNGRFPEDASERDPQILRAGASFWRVSKP